MTTYDWVIRPENESLYNQAMKYLDDLNKGETKNLLMIGEVGRGKTLLANVLVENFEEPHKSYDENGRLQRQDVRTMIVSLPELYRRVNNSFTSNENKQGLNRYIQIMKSVDLLVLDDLGRENFSENSNVYKNLLYEVVDSRFDNKPTIITSNLEYKQMTEKYDPAVISRLIPKDRERVIVFDKIADQRRA